MVLVTALPREVEQGSSRSLASLHSASLVSSRGAHPDEMTAVATEKALGRMYICGGRGRRGTTLQAGSENTIARAQSSELS